MLLMEGLLSAQVFHPCLGSTGPHLGADLEAAVAHEQAQALALERRAQLVAQRRAHAPAGAFI